MELKLPANSIWEKCFKLALQENFSDLHFAGEHLPFGRRKLILQPIGENIISKEALEQALQEIFLDVEQYKILSKESNLDFRFTYEDYSFRANVYTTYTGYAIALRKIPMEAFPLESYKAEKVLWEMAKASKGLVLICGATGTGKSSTLAAMLEAINQRESKHIITLEDPIEYVFKPSKSLIQQRELGRDFSTFSEAIKMALRQDPDLIMVGEIRDKLTMGAAMEAAETGHLVLGTLHAGSVVEGIGRIIAFFQAEEGFSRRQQLAQILTGIVAQKLVLHRDNLHCVMEILLPISAVKNLIRQNKDEQLLSQMQIHGDLGMCTMEQALNELRRQY